MQKEIEFSVIEGNQSIPNLMVSLVDIRFTSLKMEDSSVKNDKSTPQEEGQMPTDDELKKLRKREQRALERLQEARKAQSKALERFQRAEARLQKRKERLQRVEGHLTLLRQQLEQIPGQGTEHQPLSPTQPDTDSYRVGAGLAPALVVPLAPAFGIEDARAAAEAAEEHARLAAERASEIAEIPQQAEPFALPEEIASIEEEEELTSALTAETIAHITAERAAKAEVIAEISSKQSREAYRHAQDAEQALIEVRAAIRSGALSGEEAQEALWRAEHAVTRAQAFLADAEANEEQAVKAAMNAEADAVVAEGMAFAAVDHIALLVAASEMQNSSREEHALENNDDADITTKISITRPQEQS